jgi:hypothetical protein
MKTSDSINEISTALAKAQGEISNPSKEAENPHFRSHYADLSAGINAVREGLSTNGIGFVQATRLDGDVLMLDTRLTHASGQWIESEFPVCRFPMKPQEVGSAMTYARRYALFAIIGIAGEDDDGNAANASGDIPAKKRAPTPPKPPAVPSDVFDTETSQITRDVLIEAITMADTLDELSAWFEVEKHKIKKLREADKQAVMAELDSTEQSLKGKAKAA